MASTKYFLTLLLLTLLSACAYSPQQITVKPLPVIDSERYGMGKPITVVVTDQRSNKVLGSRGGIYKDTSVVTVANDLSAAIKRATETSLAAQGFNVSATDSNTVFKVLVNDIRFDVPAQSMMSLVKLAAVIGVEVSSGGEVYTSQYKTTLDRKLFGWSSTKANEEMINQLLTDTLGRMFKDQKLRAFLSNL